MWIIMQVNTNNILDEVENAIYCEDYYLSETLINSYESKDLIHKNPEINFIFYNENEYNSNLYVHLNLLRKYNILHLDQYNIVCEVKRNYTIHNFKEGYIWLNYNLNIKPKDLNKCDNPNMKSGGNFLIKLKIKKIDGNWSVVKIWTPDHWCNEKMEHDYWFTSKML